MKVVYDAEFGEDNPNALNNCPWSGVKILARSFDEAHAKAKKECDRQVKAGIKGLKIWSIKRMMPVDII
jgi:hypothetical protein